MSAKIPTAGPSQASFIDADLSLFASNTAYKLNGIVNSPTKTQMISIDDAVFSSTAWPPRN